LKKILLLLALVLVVFLVYNRQRLYLRDPLGSVARDGVKEECTEVFINYSDDVLLQNRPAPIYMTIVQHGNHVGEPKMVPCIRFLVCLMDADVVTLMAPTAPNVVVESMSGKSVAFTEGKHETVVTLR